MLDGGIDQSQAVIRVTSENADVIKSGITVTVESDSTLPPNSVSAVSDETGQVRVLVQGAASFGSIVNSISELVDFDAEIVQGDENDIFSDSVNPLPLDHAPSFGPDGSPARHVILFPADNSGATRQHVELGVSPVNDSDPEAHELITVQLVDNSTTNDYALGIPSDVTANSVASIVLYDDDGICGGATVYVSEYIDTKEPHITDSHIDADGTGKIHVEIMSANSVDWLGSETAPPPEIEFLLTGSAVYDVDYGSNVPVNGTITFPFVGTQTFDINPVSDAYFDPYETVALNLFHKGEVWTSYWPFSSPSDPNLEFAELGRECKYYNETGADDVNAPPSEYASRSLEIAEQYISSPSGFSPSVLIEDQEEDQWAIDLEIDRLPESIESESPGVLVRWNDDFFEGRLHGGGISGSHSHVELITLFGNEAASAYVPVRDSSMDRDLEHLPPVDRWVDGFVTINVPAGTDEANLSWTIPENVKVWWAYEGRSRLVSADDSQQTGNTYTVDMLGQTTIRIPIVVEGIIDTEDGLVSIQLDDGATPATLYEDSVMTSVIDVDLSVDSNNDAIPPDDGIEPDSVAEDYLEGGDNGAPSDDVNPVLVTGNYHDRDLDGVYDHYDGFDAFRGLNAQWEYGELSLVDYKIDANIKFTPLTVTVPSWLASEPQNLSFTFAYPASDPNRADIGNDAQTPDLPLEPGDTLRLWKKDAFEVRNGVATPNYPPVDFIRSGIAYSADQIGMSGGTAMLFIEGVRASDVEKLVKVSMAYAETATNGHTYSGTDSDEVTVRTIDEVTIAATNAFAVEPTDSGSSSEGDGLAFTISRGERNTSGDLDVYFQLVVDDLPTSEGGLPSPEDFAGHPDVVAYLKDAGLIAESKRENADYVLPGIDLEFIPARGDIPEAWIGKATILDGFSSVIVGVNVLGDDDVEFDEAIRLRLVPRDDFFELKAQPDNVFASKFFDIENSLKYNVRADDFNGDLLPGNTHKEAAVYILDNDSTSLPYNRNVDAESTGLVVDSIQNTTVSVGIAQGFVDLLLRLPNGGLQPVYWGNDNLDAILPIETEIPLGPDGDSPATITGKLYVAGQAGTTEEFQPVQVEEGQLYRFSLRGPTATEIAQHIRSGHYDYEAEFTFTYANGYVRKRTLRGATEIVNRFDPDIGTDEFGKRWWLPELDQLFASDGVTVARSAADPKFNKAFAAASRLATKGATAENGLVLVRGDSSTAWFEMDPSAVKDTKSVADITDWSGWYKGTNERVSEYRYTVDSLHKKKREVTYDFTALDSERRYQVFVTWIPDVSRAENAAYKVTAANEVGSAREEKVSIVDQRYVPSEFSSGDEAWRSLGYYIPVDGSLSVTVQNYYITSDGTEEWANGEVVAGSVMIVEDWSAPSPPVPDGSATSSREQRKLIYWTSDVAPTGGLAELLGSITLTTGQTVVIGKYDNVSVFDHQGLIQVRQDFNHNQSIYYYTDADVNDPPAPDEFSYDFGLYDEVDYIHRQGNLFTDLEYNIAGYLSAIEENATSLDGANGRRTTYQVNAVLSAITLGEVSQSFGYSNNHLSMVFDGKSSTNISYTDQRVSSVTNGDGAAWQLTPLIIDTLGGEVRLTQTRKIGDAVDSNRELQEAHATYTDPRGNEWQYQADAYGMLIAMAAPPRDPQNSVGDRPLWTWERNKHGLAISSTAPAGGGGITPLGALSTSYGYDGRHNLQSITYPVANGYGSDQNGDPLPLTESWNFGPASQLGSVSGESGYTDMAGNTTAYALDAVGNVMQMKVTGPNVVELDIAYSNFTPMPALIGDMPGGLPQTKVEAAMRTTAIEYYLPADLHLVGLIKHETFAVDAKEHKTTYEYDAYGYPALTRVEFDGITTETGYVYDVAGRLELQIDPDPLSGDHGPPITEFVYDGASNLIGLIDARNYVTSYDYDGMNRPTLIVEPGGVMTNRQYDLAGNLKKFISALGAETIYEYDGRSQLIETRFDTPESGPAPFPVRYQYDTLGNVAYEINGPDRITDFEYDALSRLTRRLDPHPGFSQTHGRPETKYEYYGDGLVKKITDPANAEISYEYDGLRRQTLETLPEGVSTQTSYTPLGNVEDIVFNDGYQVSNTHFTYDLFDRVKTEEVVNTPQFVEYDYSGLQRVVTTPTPAGATGPVETTEHYDALGRIVKIDYPAPGPHPDGASADHAAAVVEFRYDALGNLLESKQAVDGVERQTTNVYDARSRLIYTTESPSGSSVTTTYNDADQVRTVQVSGRGVTETVYDKLGRVWKTILPATEDHGLATTTLHYDLFGNVDERTGPEQQVIRTEYDLLDRPELIRGQQGEMTRILYNADGTQAYVGVFNGEFEVISPGIPPSPVFDDTHYTYDGLKQIDTITDPKSATTDVDYDGAGRQRRVFDANQNETTFVYDPRGLLTSETSPLGNRVYVYDDAGNLEQATDRNGRVIDYTYDTLSRRTSETWQGDADSNVGYFHYNEAGELTSASDVFGNVQIARNVAARTETRTLGYSDLIDVGLPEIELQSTFDAGGFRTNLTVSLDGAADHVNVYAPDEWGRIHQVSQSGASAATKQAKYAYRRDGQIRLIRRYEDSQFVAASAQLYYGSGQLRGIGHHDHVNDTRIAAYGMEYDAKGRITAYASLDGTTGDTVRTSYDTANQASSFTYDNDAQTDEPQIDYDPAGNPTDHTTAAYNQVRHTPSGYFEFDAEGNRTFVQHLSDTQVRKSDDQPVGDTFDSSDMTGMAWTGAHEGYAHRGLPANAEAVFEIEAESSLLPGLYQVSATWPASLDGSLQAGYARYELFDGNTSLGILGIVDQNTRPDDFVEEGVAWRRLDNVIQLTGNETDLKIKLSKDLQNQQYYLVADAVQIQKLENQQQFEWDYHNRLTRVSNQDANGAVVSTVDYFYNVLGDRIARKFDGNGDDDFYDPADEIEFYANDRGQQILDLVQNDPSDPFAGYEVKRRYLYGAAVDELLAVEETYVDDQGTPDPADDVAHSILGWTLADHQNTVRHVFGANPLAAGGGHELLEEYVYDAFGNPVERPTDSSLLDLDPHYTGRAYDPVAQLYLSAGRPYDPESRDYLQTSGRVSAAEPNFYRFAGNAPLNDTRGDGTPTLAADAGAWEWAFGPGGLVDRNSSAYFANNPDAAEWVGGMSDGAVWATAIGAAIPLGIGIYFAAPYIAGAGAGYFALQGGISAAETSVELGISAYVGEEITWGGAAGAFGKNFAINSLTGGIGNKLKWGGKASAYLLRQGIEISGDTSYDVLVRGQDFGSSLLVNAAGSIGGEALFRGVAYAARAGGPHVGRALVNTGVVSPTGIQAGYFRVQWGLGVVGHSRGNGLARRPGGYRTGDTDAHLLLSPGANRAT
ncbi:MAG: RHS repeat protein, partial [Planctomycetales bacterium]|nr:RHS repeat protein [Planctomycetales bacterium]